MKREEFNGNLDYIKNTIIERIKQEEKKKELREKLLKGYKRPTITGSSIHKSTKQKSTSTDAPKYPAAIQNQGDVHPTLLVKLEDLPENIRNIVIVSQRVFDVFVKQLNEDTWSIVEKNKGYYCDPLRFLCNFHYITKRKTTREEFDSLLHVVVEKLKDEPSLLSSMGRSKLTNEKTIVRSYTCYANYEEAPNMKSEIWQLIEPCVILEESLQPVYDAMKEEEKACSNQLSASAQLLSTY